MIKDRKQKSSQAGKLKRTERFLFYFLSVFIWPLVSHNALQAQLLVPGRFTSLLIFDQVTDASARSSGMGRTNTAAVNEITSILGNPAGLSQSGEINFYASLAYYNRDLAADSYVGDNYLNWRISPETDFKFNYFSAVFRWMDVHLGFAVGIHNLFPESVTHLISTVGDDSYRWQKDYDSGVKTSISGAIAVDITDYFFIGAAVHFWSTGEEFIRVSRSASFDSQVDEISEQERRMSDYATINFGFLYTGFTDVKLGLNLQLPHTLEVRPAYLNDDQELAAFEYTYLKNIEVNYPLALTVGASWEIYPRITLAADYDYNPWSLIKLENPIIEKAPSFNMNTIHFGIEYDWLSGSWHLPLRAGFYLQPAQIKTESGNQLRLPVFSLGSSLFVGQFRLDLAMEWMPIDYSLEKYDFDKDYSLSHVSILGNYFRFVFDIMFSSNYQNSGKKE